MLLHPLITRFTRHMLNTVSAESFLLKTGGEVACCDPKTRNMELFDESENCKEIGCTISHAYFETTDSMMVKGDLDGASVVTLMTACSPYILKPKYRPVYQLGTLIHYYDAPSSFGAVPPVISHKGS